MNAASVSMAFRGYINVVLHLLALAWEAVVGFARDAIHLISRWTAQPVDTRPLSQHLMVDLGAVNGVQGLMRERA